MSFSDDQKRLLAAVLDQVIPPSAKLPGGGEVGLAEYVDAALQHTPPLRDMIAAGLESLAQDSLAKHGGRFEELSRDQKIDLLNQQGFLLPLIFHTYTGYYQNERVLSALGREPRPPHPQGYEMAEDDLSLLDPVRRRGKLYREP